MYEGLAKKLAAAKLDFEDWTDAQLRAFMVWEQADNNRLLLFYPTGKGKTVTSLAMMKARGINHVTVVAPPKTQVAWLNDMLALDMDGTVMSHEKFRMKTTKIQRGSAIIVDEFHKLGGHGGAGFGKLDRMSQGFSAIILCSATPNYNDAERVYCVGHVLEPAAYKGGYVNWVLENCRTRPNPFARIPFVDGFRNYDGAEDFLSHQPWTAYLEDDATWIPFDLDILADVDLFELEEYGYDRRHHRIMASDIEKYHVQKRLLLLDEREEYLRVEVLKQLLDYLDKQIMPRKFLLFSEDKHVAKATHRSLMEYSKYQSNLITGDTPEKDVERTKQIFLNINMPAVLVGTATLATGVTGIETATQHLIILDDTRDDAKRRQLIGRVLTRGTIKRDTIVTTVATRT